MIPTQALPVFRAKKIDSDEWVEGEKVGNFILTNMGAIIGDSDTRFKINRDCFHEIDQSTLSVHYTNSNMEDSEGTPIFASLSSDGNGGDELLNPQGDTRLCIVKDGCCGLLQGNLHLNFQDISADYFKVTGIHTIEGEG